MIAEEDQPQPSGNWYVLFVKTNTEIKVAKALKDAGFEVFCPTHVVVRQWAIERKN